MDSWLLGAWNSAFWRVCDLLLLLSMRDNLMPNFLGPQPQERDYWER